MLCFQYKGWLRTLQVKLCGTTVSGRSRVMFGSCSNRPSIVTRVFNCFLCEYVEFHCSLQQLLAGFCAVNVTASVAGGQVVAGISLCFATSGSFPQCKWHFHVWLDHVFQCQLHFGRKSRSGLAELLRFAGVQHAFRKEVSYKARV